MGRIAPALVLGWCAAAALAQPAVPLFDGLGGYHRQVTGRSPEALRYWNQGFVFYQGFSHGMARRSFERAAELDPTCAMAHWGVALTLGPHINNLAMTDDETRQAVAAVERAKAVGGGSPVERALIDALAVRYQLPPPAHRRPLDEAYARAMRQVYQNHSDDPDVACLYAEALMDLRPWDLWSPDGEPRPETPIVTAVLEAVLAKHPDHPLACHLYIHAVEASPHPERALPAADRLRRAVPAVAHLVHMPSHIDIRMGRYAAALEANEAAIEADAIYLKRSPSLGLHSMYRAHDYHFVVYSAMFLGRSELALRRAREIAQVLPLEVIKAYPDGLEAFRAIPYHVLVRFGRWDEILAEPAPDPALPATQAFWRYARGLALSALGRVDEAAVEQTAFEAACAQVPATSLIGNNATSTVLAIGRSMLAGELAYRQGELDRAFALLRDAVARDQALWYDEPWGWMQPASHALGALLLEQGRLAEAEQVYREDLARHPDNGWSLHGLAECLRRTGRAAEAAEMEARFQRAWAAADVVITASCACRTGDR